MRDLLPWSYDNFGPDAESTIFTSSHLRTENGNIFGDIPETEILECSRKYRINMYYLVRDDGRVLYGIDVVFDLGSNIHGGLGRVKATIMLTHDDIKSINGKEASSLQDSTHPLRDMPFHEQMNQPFWGSKVIYEQAMPG